MKSDSKKAVLAALAANLGLSIAKFAGFLATGAASLLAEAVHSVADTSNQALLLVGGRAAARAPTKLHPYGFGRERYFWSFVVALVLFLLGGVFAIVEGSAKFREPVAIDNPEWAIGILLLGIVLEGASLRTAVKAATARRGGASWWSFLRSTREAELPVILLEDLGAVCGLVLAITGISLASLTGDPRFDAAGSIAIGTLLCVISALLAVELKSLLIGEAAHPEVEEAIRGALVDAPQIQRVLHMRTQHLGPDRLLIGAKLEFAAGLDVAVVAAAIDAAEARVRACLPAQAIIYLEPDLGSSGSPASAPSED